MEQLSQKEAGGGANKGTDIVEYVKVWNKKTLFLSRAFLEYTGGHELP